MSRPNPLTKWVFTINNPTDKDKQDVESLAYEYLVYQLERGASGTPHFQGALVLKKKQRFSSLKKQVPRAHWKPMEASVEQAAHYASKPHEGCECKHCKENQEGRLEGPWYRGKYRDRGTRSDLVALKQDLDSGMSLQVISEYHFSNFIRYGRGIKEYRLLHSIKRDWKTEVVFMFGPKNSGKSWWVHQLCKNLFVKPHHTWWTGFDDHSDVLFDEFTSTKYGKITDLNQWFDKYQCTAPVHGGTVNINPRRIWITSNLTPQQLFPKVDQTQPALVEAFWSRVEWIVEFKSDRSFHFHSEYFISSSYWKEGFKRL